MYEAIKNFNQQFLYEPEIINPENFVEKKSFIVIGMGGSALVAKLLKTWKPELDIIVSNDYGLPELSVEEFKNKLIILSSYSGNTEEVVDAFAEAKNKNLTMSVIATGGKLLSLAKENNVPYIKLPDTGIQPRSALGFSVKAFLKFIGEEVELKKITELSASLIPVDFEKTGKILAEKIKNYIPIIYASSRNLSLVYNWKIKMNETGKTPAFCNVFPELNHNEMNGFDTKEVNDKFYCLILKDVEDDIKILKRMIVLQKLYKDRNLKTEIIELLGENFWLKIFTNLVLADWTAYYTAMQSGLDPDQVPMVEEFKKLISE